MLLPASSLTLCFLISASLARPSSIWHISIDEDPAPPPDQGPPLSANALRDKSKLRYEIVGIFGAYIFYLVLLGILVVFVARRIQRRRQQPEATMLSLRSPVKATHAPAEARNETQSPRSGRFTSWISPPKGHKAQPSMQSVSTVDERIVERDRAKNVDEMAALYAQVMLQDEERTQKSQDSLYEQSLRSPTQQPPELQHLRSQAPPVAPSAYSLTTTAAEDEQRTAVDSRTSTRKTKVTPLSFASQGHDRADSAISAKSRPSRISVRGQAISSPINFSHPRSPNSYTEEIPLSPRIYTPGPPPLTPGQKVASDSVRELDRDEIYEYDAMPSMSPPPTPGRRSAAQQAREAERGRYSKPRAPAALSLRSQAASNSSHSLPFRQAYPDSLQSAPPIQTTFLERNPHLFNGPRTGVPSTPYSPYQPQTPLTPITPRLATRQELKKSMKKRAGPLSPEDVVPNEDEMWGKPL